MLKSINHYSIRADILSNCHKLLRLLVIRLKGNFYIVCQPVTDLLEDLLYTVSAHDLFQHILCVICDITGNVILFH